MRTLFAVYCILFAATVFAAEKSPAFDESYFEFPKDASIEELFAFLDEHEKKVPPIDNENREEAMEFLKRVFQMRLDVYSAMMEKNPDVAQIQKIGGRVEETVGVWYQITDPGTDKVFIEYMERIDKILREMLEKDYEKTLKEMIMNYRLGVFMMLGPSDSEYYAKAITYADECLEVAKNPLLRPAMLVFKMQAFEEIHKNDEDPVFFEEYERIVAQIEKEAIGGGYSPRFNMELRKITWHSEHKGTDKDVRPSLDYVKEFVLEKVSGWSHIILSMRSTFEKIGQNSEKPDYYENLIGEFQDAYRNSEKPELKNYADTIDRKKRFNKLLGNEMQIEGILLDGSKFDREPFKGKVVLVDYWATWCGPCLGEVPNMLANWEKYHERGF